MKDQINTIREALLDARSLLHDGRRQDKALTALTQLEAMVGEPVQLDHIACIDGGKLRYMTGRKAPAYDCELYAMPDGKRAPNLYAAPVAQQPQEIEVQCPVCNHKFYEWPNDKQPQAEAVPPGFVAFARDVLADFPHGFPDGFDLNDLAIKHGLLIGKTVTERCGELCNCAEYHGEDELKGGVTCYHRHAAIAQQKGGV